MLAHEFEFDTKDVKLNLVHGPRSVHCMQPKKNNSIWFFSPLSCVAQGVFLKLKLVTINPCEICLQNVQNKVFLLNTIYLRMTYLQGG